MVKMSHKKNFQKATKTLDYRKEHSPKRYKADEKAVNKVLRKRGLI
jgi:hypothetical protein